MDHRLRWALRWRLSVLWFLEWGITGAILTYLPLYFTEQGVPSDQLGLLMAVAAVGLWVAPLVVGQICDRWMAAERYLAVSHFAGGVLLVAIPIVTELREGAERPIQTLFLLLGAYACAYLPTVPLVTAMTFRHLPLPDRQFGGVRIWGTVGWVLAGVFLSLWLGRSDAYAWAVHHFPALEPTLAEVASRLAWVAAPSSSDCFHMGALLSFALASFCVFLPHSPPARTVRGAFAPLQVLRMFADRTFSLLIGISFVLALVVPFYSLAAPLLLEKMGIAGPWVPAAMTIGQISEFPALLLLPFCLRTLGLKGTFAVGMGAWVVRYLWFALERPLWLILLGVSMHGVCHVFLMIVIQLWVDRQCRPDLRTSAQNFFVFVTMGLALPIGFWLAGRIHKWSTETVVPVAGGPSVQETDYRLYFLLPAVVVCLLMFVFWKWVRLAPEGQSAPHDGPALDSGATNGSAPPLVAPAPVETAPPR